MNDWGNWDFKEGFFKLRHETEWDVIRVSIFFQKFAANAILVKKFRGNVKQN